MRKCKVCSKSFHSCQWCSPSWLSWSWPSQRSSRRWDSSQGSQRRWLPLGSNTGCWHICNKPCCFCRWSKSSGLLGLRTVRPLSCCRPCSCRGKECSWSSRSRSTRLRHMAYSRLSLQCRFYIPLLRSSLLNNLLWDFQLSYRKSRSLCKPKYSPLSCYSQPQSTNSSKRCILQDNWRIHRQSLHWSSRSKQRLKLGSS